jgi:hypothetical protein
VLAELDRSDVRGSGIAEGSAHRRTRSEVS